MESAGQNITTFHTVGDTGGIHNPQFQFAVADAMATDLRAAPHSGITWVDVVYYFGQEQYYYEQFYDPYRDYNAPIFAIPGNHDGAVYSGEPGHSLDAFVANFCAAVPAQTADSMGGPNDHGPAGCLFHTQRPVCEVHWALYQHQ